MTQYFTFFSVQLVTVRHKLSSINVAIGVTVKVMVKMSAFNKYKWTTNILSFNFSLWGFFFCKQVLFAFNCAQFLVCLFIEPNIYAAAQRPSGTVSALTLGHEFKSTLGWLILKCFPKYFPLSSEWTLKRILHTSLESLSWVVDAVVA